MPETQAVPIREKMKHARTVWENTAPFASHIPDYRDITMALEHGFKMERGGILFAVDQNIVVGIVENHGTKFSVRKSKQIKREDGSRTVSIKQELQVGVEHGDSTVVSVNKRREVLIETSDGTKQNLIFNSRWISSENSSH